MVHCPSRACPHPVRPQKMGRRDIQDVLDLAVGEPWMVTIMHALCVLHGLDAVERALPDNPYVKVGAAPLSRFWGGGTADRAHV